MSETGKNVKLIKPTRKKPGVGYGVSIFVLLMGCFFVVGAGRQLVDSMDLAMHAESVNATVTGYHRYQPHKGNVCSTLHVQAGPTWYYEPVVEFTATNGQRVSMVVSNKVLCTPPHTGSTIRVVYNSQNPHEAVLPSLSDNWGWPIAGFLFGLPFAALGIFAFRSTWKARRRQAR